VSSNAGGPPVPAMSGLELRLLDLGARIDYPPTPPLAASVRQQLAALPAAVPLRRRVAIAVGTWRRRAAAATFAVALAVAVILAVPPARTTVAHWLGIRGVEITPVRTLPPIATRTPRPPATPTVPGDSLGLGVPVTEAAAQARAGFTPLVPAAFGTPDAVWVRDDFGGVVTQLYLPRPDLPAAGATGVGLLVTEFRAATDARLFEKFVDPQTQVVPVTVGGEPGFWISGAPHELGYVLPDGSDVVDSLRLAAPTLVFQHGDLTLRIEGAITEEQALRIAASLH